MLDGLDTPYLMIMLLVGAAGAYFVGAWIDSMMGPDGFGTLPHMIILMVGGFVGLYAAEHIYLPYNQTVIRTLAAVTGGFACLALLATLKAVTNRIGF